MRQIIAILFFAMTGSAIAAEPWQANSSAINSQGTVTTRLAGWKLIHFPSTKPEFLMIGTDKLPIATVTDYPDSIEVRAFNGGAGNFITVRDKNHDHVYEEIEGLGDGTLLKLDGVTYKLVKVDGRWQLTSSP